MRSFELFVLLGLALAASACGGGSNDCTGYVTINVTPAECERIAQQFGCPQFDVTGTSCGLSGCATCVDL